MHNISMTILVTGAAGFIGSNICKQLLRGDKSTTVIGVDSYSPYYNPSLKKRRVAAIKKSYKNFVFVCSSFYQTSMLATIQKKYKLSALIHAAAEVGVRNGESHPTDYIQTNTLGTSMLLETIGQNLKHIILLSSSSVYGRAPLPFHETNVLRPTSVYGVSKMFMESYANNFHGRASVPITIVRPFSVYGPDGRPDMLPMKLLYASLSNHPITVTGRMVQRDWTYIEDFTTALSYILKNPRGFEQINIGFGKPLSNLKVVRAARRIILSHGYVLQYSFISKNPVEMSRTWADTQKLNTIYNISLSTSFEEGFQKTAQYFFSHKTFYAKHLS